MYIYIYMTYHIRENILYENKKINQDRITIHRELRFDIKKSHDFLMVT